MKEISSRLPTLSPLPDGMSVLDKLKSRLWFPSISDREGNIDPQHQKSLEWMFADPETEGDGSLGSSRTFVDWVRNGTGMYWVGDKVGCGKSTMIKFLAKDPRTRSHLQDWASTVTRGQGLVLAAFYFWILHPKTSSQLKSFNYNIIDNLLGLQTINLANQASFETFF